MTKAKYITANNITYLQTLPENSLDSIVTDCPYGLGKEPYPLEVMQAWIKTGYHEVEGSGFMGKKWDSFVPQPIFWKEIFRVLKPGGHILAFFGTRTYDWGVMAMRFSGFEIRDQIQWIYGSGFPKSRDVSKDMEAARLIEESEKWDGWGTALKPANEPICLARKPIEKGLTVAQNVIKWGTGAIWIDGCRIESDDEIKNHSRGAESAISKGKYGDSKEQQTHQTDGQKLGRFPANVILDEEAAQMLDDQTGILKTGAMKKPYTYTNNGFSLGRPTGETRANHEANQGGASRFFYCAKTSKKERAEGLEGQKRDVSRNDGDPGGNNPRNRGSEKVQNFHPTVKPISLMRYCVRMITPKGGKCCDPFCGSGSTGIACDMEEIESINIDNEPDYIEISEARSLAWNKNKDTQTKMF